MLHAKFQDHRTSGSGEEELYLKAFIHSLVQINTVVSEKI